ncbi:MAG: hydantoinase/oxoprolinase family protein [Anaerolineales bacterium]|nr:hydantoinase/oxoprolinase family protein [Anaerolineales bacterium]
MGGTSAPGIMIGVDVGGTFTDIVVYRSGASDLSVEKVLTTPGRLWEAIIHGLKKVLGEQYAQSLSEARIVHATTQATNALIEGNTAKVALLTNKGFRDVLEIRRHYRGHLYDFFLKLPEPLVPRNRRIEIEGRMDPTGAEIVPLASETASSEIRRLEMEGVQSYAVCFLHSYANPAHEAEIEAQIKAVNPAAYVTCSHAVCPEYREYERTSTTVVNAAVMPLVDQYLSELEAQLRQGGYKKKLFVMQSNGGTMTAEDIRVTPVNIIESGPAAGVVAAMAIGSSSGRKNLISFDMGGTTAKAALITNGRVEFTSEYEVGAEGHGADRQSGYPIRVPVMQIAEVGAGGGSIAWVDAGKALRVGPISAGAEPGPVCYSRGGTRPTTTDANLVLGRLGADSFLGGEMKLDVEAARAAISKHICNHLQIGIEEAAAGIIEISNSHMARALRRVSVEKGYHPKDYTLIAFGGAGPLQAAYLAEDLGMAELIVPPYPGVASAVGMLSSDLRHEKVSAFFCDLQSVDLDALNASISSAAAALQRELVQAGVTPDSIELTSSADLRYKGQAYEVRADWPEEHIDSSAIERMVERFHDLHYRNFSFNDHGRSIEIVALRVTAIGRNAKMDDRKIGTWSGGAATTKGARDVYFRGVGHLKAGIYERTCIPFDQQVDGPAIIEQKDSTTLVPPGWSAKSQMGGLLVLKRAAAQDVSR